MTRICILCEIWGSGGIEAFLCNIITYMDCSDLEIDLVAAKLEKSVFMQPLQELGIQFYQLSGSNRKIIENYKLLKQLFIKRRYDVVYLNAYQGLSLAYLKLARKENVSMRIAHSHNTALRKSLTRPLKSLLHCWAKNRYAGEITDFWACSKPAAEYLFPKRELRKNGYTFIPNGIDMQRFCFNVDKRQNIRKELKLNENFVIGNVGRFCYQKNQDFLLDVFHEVIKYRPDSNLLLVGDGPDRKVLEDKAKRLGLSDYILFYGMTTHVECLYSAMDAFVMPSRFEGLPVTGIEAQVSGLPCLFSKNITQECDLGSGAIFLPLEEGPAYWAKILLRFKQSCNRVSVIENSTFEIRTVAKKIRQKWIG